MKLTPVLSALLILMLSFKKPEQYLISGSLKQQPDSSRFTASTLVQGLDEPMAMGILPNDNVLIIERKGGLRMYDAAVKELKTVAHLNVFSGIEDGLLGVAVDPDYAHNNWIYLYYGVGGDKWVSHLARYELIGDQLNLASKKVLLQVPTQRKYCCHSAGYLTFSKGLLYLSTGDNTNAEEIEGHNPTDERPGRELSDDQASTANSNDLRGKILRIKPEPDGTYSIPDGNLFPKDGSMGRAEIYVMGCRNPFRMSVDDRNGFVYWGDVGPDTNVPAEEGTLSYDEINQARKPGFFGYPYFLGNNEAFPKYDFATKKEGPKQNPLKPVNNSPHNTGIRDLPAAQPALIWYGKQPSARFPLVGKGGASAMAGPVYYRDQFPGSIYRLPEHYNGKLFIYDWIRKWIMAVTLDQEGNYVSMEPFLDHLKFVAPMDMQFHSDGSLYILAYGTNWFSNNTDAALIRVEYSEGNRRPIADIRIDKQYGAAPMTVKLSAEGSKDYDTGDQLKFCWQVGEEKLTGMFAAITLDKPGVYPVTLTATDSEGAQGVSTAYVHVGNTPPKVRIISKANQSFYWDHTKFDYRIQIRDQEDKTIDPAKVTATFAYLPFGKDIASVLSAGAVSSTYYQGEKLVAQSDCRSCHAMEKASIGPSWKAVAGKYEPDNRIVEQLAGKIIKGGAGVWGTYAMSAHPDLPTEEAKQMVAYILSLNKPKPKLAMQGELMLNKHIGKGDQGAYVLLAGYQDKGANGIAPLSSREYVTLRHALIQMEDNDRGNVGVVIATANTGYVSYIRKIQNNSFVVFNRLDLSHISKINFRVQPHGAGGKIEVRLDSLKGPIVGDVTILSGVIQDLKTGWTDVSARITPTLGMHNLHFVFVNSSAGKKELFHIDWMYFDRSSQTKQNASSN